MKVQGSPAMRISDAPASSLPFSHLKQACPGLERRLLTLVGVSTAWIVVCLSSANAAELTNASFRIELGTSSSGLPIITQGIWVKTNTPAFTGADDAADLTSWLPDGLIPAGGVRVKSDPWRLTENGSFVVSEA